MTPKHPEVVVELMGDEDVLELAARCKAAASGAGLSPEEWDGFFDELATAAGPYEADEIAREWFTVETMEDER